MFKINNKTRFINIEFASYNIKSFAKGCAFLSHDILRCSIVFVREKNTAYISIFSKRSQAFLVFKRHPKFSYDRSRIDFSSYCANSASSFF